MYNIIVTFALVKEKHLVSLISRLLIMFAWVQYID